MIKGIFFFVLAMFIAIPACADTATDVSVSGDGIWVDVVSMNYHGKQNVHEASSGTHLSVHGGIAEVAMVAGEQVSRSSVSAQDAYVSLNIYANDCSTSKCYMAHHTMTSKVAEIELNTYVDTDSVEVDLLATGNERSHLIYQGESIRRADYNATNKTVEELYMEKSRVDVYALSGFASISIGIVDMAPAGAGEEEPAYCPFFQNVKDYVEGMK